MKIVMAQCNFKVSDFVGNANKIISVIAEWGNQADLIVFSELSVSGYFPMDLMDRPGFLHAQEAALRQIKKATENCQAAVVVGAVAVNQWAGKALHNALLVYENGVQVFEYHKKLLPTYNVFDEARYFEPGQLPSTWQYKGKRLGFLICEDGWFDQLNPNYTLDPVDALAREQLDLVVSINASPSHAGKAEERLDYFANISRRCDAALIYVNQIGGNDELVFDGHSFALNAAGEMVRSLPKFEEASGELSLESLPPVMVADPVSDMSLYYKQLTLGIRDYVAKSGFDKVLVGSSGGIDSAVTLALAVEALGSEAVVAITMPARYSSTGSVADSEALCAALNVRCYNVSIEAEFTLGIERFEQAFAELPSGLTMENMQARIRGKLLMEYANHFGALVLSTGNKTEMSVGYATLYGDMNGGLNALGDLYKMEVYTLAEYINQQSHEPKIPQQIIDKAPSAELSEDQKDQDSLPPYPQLDAIVRLAIERDLMSEEEIVNHESIISAMPFQEVAAIMNQIDRMEFKRGQAPPIIRVHRRSFGVGRRIPIVQGFDYLI